MSLLPKEFSGYLRLTAYRKGIYEKAFVHENVQSLMIVTLVFGVGLLFNAAIYGLTGSAGLMTSAEGWLLIAVLLLGTMISFICFRRWENEPRPLKRIYWGLFSVLFICLLIVSHKEICLGGSLYVYSVALTVIGMMLNLPLRRAAASILLFDAVNAFFLHRCGIQFWQETHIQPYRYMFFLTIVALGAAMQRHVNYLILMRQRASLLSLGHTDPLTGLLNRRGMENYLQQASHASKIHAVLFDIDNFKMYNDTYGHEAGDVCLMRVSKLLRELVEGKEAIAVRYGGEELLLLFFDIDGDAVKKYVEQGLRRLWNMKLPSGDGATQPFLSMSCGIAKGVVQAEGSVETVYQLIAAADQKLYAAKREGKNRCVS